MLSNENCLTQSQTCATLIFHHIITLLFIYKYFHPSYSREHIHIVGMLNSCTGNYSQYVS